MSHDFFRSWRKSNDATLIDRKLVLSQKPFRIPSGKQFKYLSKVLSKREQISVSFACILLVVSTLIFGWKIVIFQTKEIPAQGGVYSEALVGEPQYINPLFIQSNDVDRDIVSLVYSGLLHYTTDRKVAPDLAEKTEISPDGTVYTFTLRKNIQWHDGKPFTARDVVFTILKIQDAQVKSPYLLSFKNVKVEEVNESTVRFHLDKPFAPFLDLMTLPVIPEHLWSSIPSESIHLASLNLKPIGTGPWKFQSLKRDKDGSIRSYSLEKNEKYYGSMPFIDKLHFRLYPDSDSAIQALKNKQVDGVSFLPHNLSDRLKKQTEFSIYTFNLPQYTALFFNQGKNQSLEQKNVRAALALALDKNAIVKNVLEGEGEVIHAPLLKNFIGYHKDVKMYPYDLVKAGELLQQAGWKKNDQGHWVTDTPTLQKQKQKQGDTKAKKEKKNEAIFHITLTTVQSQEGVALAEKIKSYWSALGVDVDIQAVDPSRIKTDIIDPRNYEVFLYGEIIGSDPDLYPFWHSSQVVAPGLNLALFSNKDADGLLEEGRRTSDVSKRSGAYEKFQDILAEELPAIFLFNPSYTYVVSKKIHGIADKKQIIYPADRFIDLSSWYSKKKRTWRK